MNTDFTPSLNDATQLISGLVQQIQSWPAAVLLAVCLIVIGVVLKSLALFPNKFIPVTILLGGALINLLIGDPGQVDPAQRHPDVILAMWGFCVGAAAWVAHAVFLKRFEKYLPFLEEKTSPPPNP